jgi:hypothetical protein
MLRNLVWQRSDFVYGRDVVPGGLVRLAELSSFLILILVSNLSE